MACIELALKGHAELVDEDGAALGQVIDPHLERGKRIAQVQPGERGDHHVEWPEAERGDGLVHGLCCLHCDTREDLDVDSREALASKR